MEFGNVYEVLHTGDIVKVKDIASIYCGHIGVIVSIDNQGCYVDPIYTVRFDEPYKTQFFNAKNLVKVGHVVHEGEITMGLRSGKTYLTEIGKCKNKDNGFDSIIYQMEKKRKFAERGTDEMKKISQDYDKFMRELCPWLYTGEKLTEVDSACANAVSDFYKKEFIKGKDNECTEELAKIQDGIAKTLYETMLSLMRAINEDMEKNNGNN